MRFVALALFGCAAASSQSLVILPPSLDSIGQKVFFGSSLSPDGLQHALDIYALDSGGVKRLTQIGSDANSTIFGFAVSPDGSHLAYTGFKGLAEVLRSVNLNSGESSVWTCPGPPCDSRSRLHISGPDNTIIIGGNRTTQYSPEIYVVNSDGSFTSLGRGMLAPSPQRVISDNGLIAFTDASFSSNVYVMNLDGSNRQPLTHFPATPNVLSTQDALDATISQSGSLVVFTTSNRTQPVLSQIWAVLSDGLLRNLTRPEENCDSPSVSGDGTLAAFICNGQVYVERTDGTARRALTNFRWSSAASPVISADGSRVVFTIGPRENINASPAAAIYSIGTDGTRLEALYAPRVLNARGIVDSLTAARSPFIAVGDLITAFGANFTADALAVAGQRPLPETLNGVSLLVNGRAAPILAVTPWQINAQLPAWVPEGTATFQVRFTDGSASTVTTQQVVSSAPEVLTLPNDPYPDCQSAVFHAGTGVVANQLHPSTVGEIVEIYAIGLGPTDPVVLPGMPAPSSPPAMAIGPTTVSISDRLNDVDAPVLFAGLAPGLIGIYQVNARVTNGLQGRRYVFLRVKNGPTIGAECPFWVH